MKALLLGGLLALSAALPAAAVDWVMVGNNERVELYVDNDSIKTNGQDFIYTSKTVDYQNQEVRLSTTLLGCSSATVRPISFAAFTMNGRLIVKGKSKPETLPIAANTFTATIYDQLCN